VSTRVVSRDSCRPPSRRRRCRRVGCTYTAAFLDTYVVKFQYRPDTCLTPAGGAKPYHIRGGKKKRTDHLHKIARREIRPRARLQARQQEGKHTGYCVYRIPTVPYSLFCLGLSREPTNCLEKRAISAHQQSNISLYSGERDSCLGLWSQVAAYKGGSKLCSTRHSHE
jgi:hypothetical protein